MTTYKVSIVILGTEHGGAIINLTDMPVVGQRLTVGDLDVEILEVVDLLPPRGEFHYLHATCRLAGPEKTDLPANTDSLAKTHPLSKTHPPHKIRPPDKS